MSLLERFFGRSKPKSGAEVFEELLREHLARLKNQSAKAQAYPIMEPRWNKLLRSEILSFTATRGTEQMKQSLQERKHLYRGQKFEDVYVMVSTVPSANPAQAMTYFEGGYTVFVDTLLNESRFDPNICDFAHWVFCSDGERMGVHFTFLPAKKLENFIMVVAQDLMTASEKSNMGIA